MFNDHTNKIFFNNDQRLLHDCKSMTNILPDQQDIIIAKINNYLCESNNWHGKFSYWIKNCNFKLDSFKEIVNMIFSHIMQCKEEIMQHLSSNNNCVISIDFSNQENNTNIGLEGTNHLIKAMHTVIKRLNNSLEFIIQLKNNGVLIDTVKELTQSCPNINVEHLAELHMKDGKYNFTSDNDNNFAIFLNNTNINDTSCIFNQHSYSEEKQVQVSSLHLFPLLVLSASSAVVGLTYVYNYRIAIYNSIYNYCTSACNSIYSYCTSKEIVHNTYDVVVPIEVECAGTHHHE